LGIWGVSKFVDVSVSEGLDGLVFIRNDSATKRKIAQKKIRMNTQVNKNSLLKRSAEWFLVATLGGMVAAVFINVVLRYGFGTGIVFYEELSRLLFVWLVSIGAVLAAADGQHLNFDMLTSKLKGSPIVIASVLSRLAVAVCLALVLHGSWAQVKAGLASFSTVMGYPLALVAASTLFMSAVMLILLFLEVKNDPLGIKAHQALLSKHDEHSIE
jgi:TRAP-type transport system small permease protein